MLKCVYTAKNPWDGPHVAILKKAGFEFEHIYDTPNVFEEQGLVSVLKDASAVIAGSEPYTARILDQLPKLRVIARAGVGFDAVDLEACDHHQIAVCTTPGVNHHSVAEHAIALLMGVARGFPGLDQKVRKADWSRKPFPRVMGKTIGLVGLGRIGQATATRAIGLGMHVIAYDPYANTEFVAQWKIELVDLNTLLARSDFVSLHCPVTKESINLMNQERFARMKKGSVLINTARGQLVDETALLETLKAGHLAAAGLDVFQEEPLPLNSPLLGMENVFVSGHVAGLDDQSLHDTNKMCAENIVSLYEGRWPAGCVQNLRGKEESWQW